MPSVQIRENEPFEIALRRFKGVKKLGHTSKLVDVNFTEKPTSVRKRKIAANARDISEKRA